MRFQSQNAGEIVLVALLCLLAIPSDAQAKPAAEPPKAVAPSSSDRQKAMQADLERLLQLARQLKSEVDNTRKDELSLKVIHDADEIDRLARSARGRIR